MNAISFDQNGFAVVPDVIDAELCATLRSLSDEWSRAGAGTRSLLASDADDGPVRCLARRLMGHPVVSGCLPSDPVAVQCTFFGRLADSLPEAGRIGSSPGIRTAVCHVDRVSDASRFRGGRLKKGKRLSRHRPKFSKRSWPCVCIWTTAARTTAPCWCGPVRTARGCCASPSWTNGARASRVWPARCRPGERS